jgi:16S rRNA (guanine527-N7)-methyltransferase
LGQQPAHRAAYDWAVARAVAEMRVLAEYLLPLCRIGGHMLALKGENAPAEVDAALPVCRLLGGDVPELHSRRLPGREKSHYLVVVAKIGESPAAYPRRPGLPSKRPLA